MALTALAGLVLLAAPALAQLGQRNGSPFDSFFRPFSAPRYAPTERPVDSSRAPPPRKQETTPTETVLVLGDSMADWLAYGLEDALSDTPEIGVVRKHRTYSGLVRYDTRDESHDWAMAAREAIAATKPKFVIMMLGLGDRQALRVRPQQQGAAAPAAGAAQPQAGNAPKEGQGSSQQAAPAANEAHTIIAPEPPPHKGIQTFEFRSEQWVEQYIKRIDATIAAMKSGGATVFWVGLPAIRGPKSTADMQFLDDLYRTRAEKAGITYIDIWDGFVDESGRFTVHGPDFEGQTRRLRTADGVHFTKAGARKLAHFVERELRRVMTKGVTTVALPSSEPAPAQTPAARPGMPTPRPLVGPVLPLTAPATGQQDLVGSGTAPKAPPAWPVATRVLQKGEPLTPPAGRADDFAWPRRDVAPFGTDPAVATTTDPLPVMHATPATTVPVPKEETRAVAAVAAPRKPRPPQQQQPKRQAPTFSFFPFFR